MYAQKLEFAGAGGDRLAALLDSPESGVRAYALFAHCFTCGKDVFAASRIAQALAAHGIAVLRFDFTGLGASEGEFANTNFSSNLADLQAAADFLRREFQAPRLLIGHSLGGAATLAFAGSVPEVQAVVTIAAPSDPVHVTQLFGEQIDAITAQGEAMVQLAGRPFRIKRQFLEDVAENSLRNKIATMRKALLIMHAPGDATVGINNALEIFAAAKHPKSFISLDTADHLLSVREDAVYVAGLIAAWSARYIK
ncbi:alpha/beta fold hydrolase [Pseudoduganella eburnea]|uniref:Alpha/beta fold hydrolase n=1 Tax=Massilia eburnea TaxID=1776165 RepID=A0A6L6QIC3_9BURK|nr:alpha/beta hydrolase [Massilia eburnea]MTW11363.1 alpha/beta fold hydrolase [Massilia eburnea]